MKMFFKMKTLTIIIGLLLALTACSNSQSSNSNGDTQQPDAGGASKEINLRFMAAPQSGSWYPLAVGITEILKTNMDNVSQVSIEPGGGVANVIGVNNGQAQLGFSQSAPTVDGFNGTGPFDKKQEDIRYIGSLFPHKTHIVVLKGSGIKSIEDIKGKRINVGTKGLLTEDLANRILNVYGMTYDDMESVQYLSFSDSVEQMKDGRIDVLFWTVPEPFAVLTDLSQSKEVEFLPIPDEKVDELVKQNSGFKKSTIAAGIYKGQDKDVNTIQSPLVILANKNTPDDLVYETTKILVNELEKLGDINPTIKKLSKEDVVSDIGIPMHPAAEKFYKENSLLK
jgi:TRAP transporter TAXI family solute receptor